VSIHLFFNSFAALDEVIFMYFNLPKVFFDKTKASSSNLIIFKSKG